MFQKRLKKVVIVGTSYCECGRNRLSCCDSLGQFVCRHQSCKGESKKWNCLKIPSTLLLTPYQLFVDKVSKIKSDHVGSSK